MSELKTLKDIDFRADWEDPTEDDAGYVYYEEPTDLLKQEAIKWIKLYEEHIEIKAKLTNSECEVEWIVSEKEARRYLAIIEFIKYFFNITEEDLK